MALEMAIQAEELAILSSTNGTRNDLLLSFPKAFGFFALHSSRPEPTQIKFVVLVLSEAVLSETVLVLDGCLNCGDAAR